MTLYHPLRLPAQPIVPRAFRAVSGWIDARRARREAATALAGLTPEMIEDIGAAREDCREISSIAAFCPQIVAIDAFMPRRR